MDVELFGVRISTGQATKIRSTREGALHVVQHLPPYAVLSALGGVVRVDCTSDVASVVAIPTTTAMLTVWNGDTERSYVIDKLIASIWDVNNNDEGQITIVSCLHPVGMAQPSAQDLTPKKMNGNGSYGGNAWCDVGATVIDNGWQPWDSMNITNLSDDAIPGGSVIADIEGRIVLPPRAGLSMSVLSDAVAQTVKCAMSWFEVYLDLG